MNGRMVPTNSEATGVRNRALRLGVSKLEQPEELLVDRTY